MGHDGPSTSVQSEDEVSVTIFGSCFGGYRHYAQGWAAAIERMDPQPDAVVLAVDALMPLPGFVEQTVTTPMTRWPIPGYNNHALSWVTTEWAWRMDIDDQPMPDMLLDFSTDCDVWHGGYENQHGHVYIPGDVTADEVLAAPYNPILSASAFRTALWRDGSRFPDIAFDDWGLWRRFARDGAKFKSAGRGTYLYDFHPHTSVSGQHASDANTREALGC
jgi:hypothetical protein